MKLKLEIQELFDKFNGGAYCYKNSDGTIELEIKNRGNFVQLSTNNNDTINAEIRLFTTGKIYICHHKEDTTYVCGDSALFIEHAHELVQDAIIEVKHYFEENGFDKDLYDEDMFSFYNEQEMSI